MAASRGARGKIVSQFKEALLTNALPGELAGFAGKEQDEAAALVAEVAAHRKSGEPKIELRTIGGGAGKRRMRLVVINDDMPFLVDSVSNAIARNQLSIYRLLHPVVCSERDSKGKLKSIGPICDDENNRESIIYVELDRAYARGRQELLADIRAVLADVYAAVRDWRKMQSQMREDAAKIEEKEGKDLLNWFADGAMTLLGYQVERPGKKPSSTMGIFSIPGAPTDKGGCEDAIRYFEEGGSVPLMAKAERKSTVHRRVPLDLVVVPIRKGKKITGIGVHAGLWTSQALILPIEEVPVLRKRLASLDKKFDFDPGGHKGKALRHAVASVPRDLMINLGEQDARDLVSMAMTLADRPRPALLILRSILKGHMFVFVWLPREELNTRRRNAITNMIEEAVGGPVTSWAVELGEGDLALLRFTLDVQADTPTPDQEELNRKIDVMVRGWEPSVEEQLIERVGAPRATRLAMTYGDEFPDGYKSNTDPADAAEDILRLVRLKGDRARDVRIYREAGEDGDQLKLKIYRAGGFIPLSEAVPVLENFGFNVLEEIPTALTGDEDGHIHDFRVSLPSSRAIEPVFEQIAVIEDAISSVLRDDAEDDAFNQLVVFAGLTPQSVVWLRAWFRYLRQTGVSYGLLTFVEALSSHVEATTALVELFRAAHDPEAKHGRASRVTEAREAFNDALRRVQGIDDDQIFRMLRSVVEATLRTNAFALEPGVALAFKIESSQIPSLPSPVPWREIWVYSPRVEGIHLRGGPVARGGLRWSDRRDDFRTEILGLVKAQLVKNAVIVPTGAKGGFYPKQLPNPSDDRDKWFEEGTESYRIFIRSLLSITDNIVDDEVVHPDGVVIEDGEDPYFVVAADKGTASFSDVANAIALERGFWLGDAFASGGSNGYDHKAMGITARGAWVSVQRHFLEMGVDVQSDPITVIGVGDMSGDVFGNGMLLSKSLKIVAAFDHRHIFIDPDPDPAESWKERKRLFDMPRSSWADYDRKKMSRGGMIVARTEKRIKLTVAAREALGTELEEMDPNELMSVILKAPADLLWFGGIGTYVKASSQTDAQVGDPANDALRVNGDELRVKAIGEGANLGITQLGRIEFAQNGGRINTDFIDNSAGVDCSDNEVNIKIPLNRKMREGDLEEKQRNKLLEQMTEEVGEIVLEDNRLQALALSIAEAGGAMALPEHVRTIEQLEQSGRLNRRVESIASSDILLRRALDNTGLTRPELSVVLSMSKLALQDAAETLELADDPLLEPQLLAAFPEPMVKAHKQAILAHRLRHEILATKVANRIVNRLGPSVPLSLTEEEGASLGQVACAFLTAEHLLGLQDLWDQIEHAAVPEAVRIELFQVAAKSIRSHMSDILRSTGAEKRVHELVDKLGPGVRKVDKAAARLIRSEVRNEAAARREHLVSLGADNAIVDGLVRLYELDGVFGVAALSAKKEIDVLVLTKAYTMLGEALGLDWAQQQVARFQASDQWERLLVAGLERDFEQLRIEFLARTRDKDPTASVDRWISRHSARIEQFRRLVSQAKNAGAATAPMLAQIAAQARIVLGR